MNDKGLLFVYNAHNLLEFFWYYCTDKEARQKEWDALCLPSGAKGEYMSGYCKKCGVFKNVFSDDKAFSDASSKSQLKMFSGMFFSLLVGKRKSFCRKTLNKYVNIDSYGEIVVLSDFGLLSGFAMRLSKNKKTVVLEDGTGDYNTRARRNIFSHFTDTFHWKGFIISLMGYSNSAYFYPLSSTKHCIKYSSHPDMMTYKRYKEMRRLFDFSDTDMVLYDEILRRTYEELNNYDFNSADTVYFTNNLGDFVKNTDKYREKLENYFGKTSDSLFIKKHPRDEIIYEIPGTAVTELEQALPAEVFLPYLVGKNTVFIFPTSILLYMNSKDFNVKCLYLDGMYEESISEITHADYEKEETIKSLFGKYGADDAEYIHI